MLKYLKKTGLCIFSYLPSQVKLAAYKSLGAKIQENVYLGLGSYIIPYESSFNKISIGKNTIIGDDVSIIAKGFKAGHDSEIKDHTKITGEKSFSMGNYSYIDQNVLVNLRRDVEMGDESGIGANSSLYTHGVWLAALDGAPVKFGKITIGNKVWIASNVFIMPGISIGDNAILGACSVVTRSIEKNTVNTGNPSKTLKTFNPNIKLDPEEKNTLVKDLIKEVIDRYDEKVSEVTDSEDMIRFHITLEKKRMKLLKDNVTYLVFYKRKCNNEVLNEISKEENKVEGIVVIGIEYDDLIKQKLEENKISWMDMEKRRMHINPNKCNTLLIKSFKNNGIRFENNN